MRGWASIAVGIAVVTTGGCATPDKFRGLDGAPGEYVSGTSPLQRGFSAINPFSDYNSQWTLVRVIAPPGATKCRVADTNPFRPVGPMTIGAPNARREVMLAYDALAKSAAFECRTPAGVVKRTVKAVPYDWPQHPSFPTKFGVTTQVKPPLVHIDPTDVEAERRWRELSAELCPVVSERASFVCKPGMLEKLKAQDLHPTS